MKIIGMENVTEFRKCMLDNASEYRLFWLDGEQVVDGMNHIWNWDRLCRVGMVKAGKNGQTEVEVYDGQLLYAVGYISRVNTRSILDLLELRPGEIVFSIEVTFADTES